MFKTYVQVTTNFVAAHYWPDAPDRRSFLRDVHRHKFGVAVTISVDHDDREVEFFDLQDQIDAFVYGNFTNTISTNSCEQFARTIVEHLIDTFGDSRRIECSVDEDGENSSLVAWVPPTRLA